MDNLNTAIQTVVVGAVIVVIIALLIPAIGSVGDSGDGGSTGYETVTEFGGTTLEDDVWNIERQPDDENISDVSLSDDELEITQEGQGGTFAIYDSGYGVETGMNLTATLDLSGWDPNSRPVTTVGFGEGFVDAGDTTQNGTFQLILATPDDDEVVLSYNYAEPGETVGHTELGEIWNASEDDLGQMDFRLETGENSSTLYVDDYGVMDGLQSYEIDESIDYDAMPESTLFAVGLNEQPDESYTAVFGEVQAETANTNGSSGGGLLDFESTTATLVSFASLALVVPVVVAVIGVLSGSFGDLLARRRGGR